MFHFYTPWKRQKTRRFLTFAEGIKMEHSLKIGSWHCVKSVRIQNTETQSIFPYSVQMWENKDQKNSEYRHFSRSVVNTNLFSWPNFQVSICLAIKKSCIFHRYIYNRSNHRRCSVKKGVLEKFTNFTGKHLCWSHFLIKLQAYSPALLKTDSNTGASLWNLQNF